MGLAPGRIPPPDAITTSPAVPLPDRTAPVFTFTVVLPRAPVTTKVPELTFVAPVYVFVPLSVNEFGPSLLTAIPPLIADARVRSAVRLKSTVLPATPLMLLGDRTCRPAGTNLQRAAGAHRSGAGERVGAGERESAGARSGQPERGGGAILHDAVEGRIAGNVDRQNGWHRGAVVFDKGAECRRAAGTIQAVHSHAVAVEPQPGADRRSAGVERHCVGRRRVQRRDCSTARSRR